VQEYIIVIKRVSNPYGLRRDRVQPFLIRIRKIKKIYKMKLERIFEDLVEFYGDCNNKRYNYNENHPKVMDFITSTNS
jgi:hypothetical protein